MAELYEILRDMGPQNYVPKERSERMEAARQYILTQFRNPDFDYDALCAATGLSYSAFSREFHAVFHTSPVKMVTRMRMDHARELLVTGRYSVTEAAECCGYRNVYYFSNVFKREVGISPKEYKKKTDETC